jgi:hypothetical protein
MSDAEAGQHSKVQSSKRLPFEDLMRLPHIIFVLATVVLLAAPAPAQEVGIRAGASADPGQFYFGGHLETPPVADRLHFRPNVEIGLGDDVTLTALNFELVYRFESNRPWAFYAGGGPALNIVNHRSDTDARGGFNILGGAQHRDGLFFEMKVGALDSPDFKFGVGYVFER